METFAVTCFDLDEFKGFGADKLSAKADFNGVLLFTFY